MIESEQAEEDSPHAQLCQRNQAAQTGRDGAVELVVVEVPANAKVMSV